MILEYNKFSMLNISIGYIEDFFLDLLDNYDAKTFPRINENYISVVIFIEYKIWENHSKSINKEISECFIRLRDATGLIRIDDKRDMKTKIDKKDFWMISRNLTLK